LSAPLIVAAALAPVLVPADAATLDRFEALLASHDSATEALALWCAAEHLAVTPEIRVRRIIGADAPAPPGLARLLGAGPRAKIGYRHVALTCGEHVLSEAHNWYVRNRLTPAMNQALDSSDIPFGRVAAPLHFRREPLDRQRGLCPNGAITTHRARLRLADGAPLALVIECYTAANLAGGGG
jgi:chorismate-pyruvate lyase